MEWSRSHGAGAPPLIQYWDSADVPDYIEGLLASFAAHNPDMSHTVFTESTAEELIASRFSARELACFRACAVPAMQADYLRYCALLALGGVYADADLRCEGSLRWLVEGEPGGRLFRGGGTIALGASGVTTIVNWLLAFARPRHPLLELALAIATATIEQRMAERLVPPPGSERPPGAGIWLTTGPGVLTALHLIDGLGSLDAFLELMGETESAALARLVCEVVGDHDRVAEAFRDVGIAPAAECAAVRGPGIGLPYKATRRHWMHAAGDIYR